VADLALGRDGAACSFTSSRLEVSVVQQPKPSGRVNTTRWASSRYSLMAALLVALAGFGATAFGVAVHMPTPAAGSWRIVSEPIATLDTELQLEALAAHRLDFYRADVTRAGDNVASLLGRLNIRDTSAAEFLRTDAASRTLFDGSPGKSVRARVDSAGRLIELIARFSPSDRSRSATHFSRLRVESIGGRLISMIETAALAAEIKVGNGHVTTSMFAATDAAGIPEAVASQMADALSGDIDFHRNLRKGDTFAVVYEVMTADTEPVTWRHIPERLLAAEFTAQGRQHSAVWFQDTNGGKGAYFSFDGQSKRRAFLASPLEFSRVSSGFSGRIHPLLKQWQQHQGVDYAAPAGTPVRSVGDGVVGFAGVKSGYGNVVEVRHSGGRGTLYAHLKRIDVRLGQRVERGDRLGSVGATGWATGPHLHFEFKVGGVPRNPARLAQWSETAQLGSGGQPVFAAWAKGFQGRIDLAQATLRSGSYAE
jgi:murein DD-endopeptidase MepM/ murein hydrolase activator NlpD